MTREAASSVPIDPLLSRRYSGRSYDKQRDIPADTVLALLEAARWAPSCYGDQPWNYVVCRRAEEAAAWSDAIACLAPGNREWAQDAPLLLLAVATREFRQRQNLNQWSDYDTGAASMALCLQATSSGLIAHQMGGFDPAMTRQKFSIPQDHTAMAFIAVGYPLATDQVPPQLAERENKPRARLPLSSNFFSGRWDSDLQL